MSTSEHTKGPWPLWHSDKGAFQIEVGGFIVCSRNDVSHRAEESIANAHLIAAAPDMLSALYEAASALDAVDPRGGKLTHPPIVEFIEMSLAPIRAAIAKAEGRS